MNETTEVLSTRAQVATALEHISEGVLLVDTEWRIIYANTNAATMSQLPIAELVGGSLWDVFPHADGPDFGDHYRDAMATQEMQTIEADYGPSRGWFVIRAFPSPTVLTLYFQNIDERRTADATQTALVTRLEATLFRLNLTQSVVVALAETLSIGDVATVVLQLAKRTLDTMVAGVALLTDDGASLRFVSLVPFAVPAVAELAPVPLGTSSPLADCVRLQQSLYHSSRSELLATYPGVRSAITTAGTHAFGTVPLTVGGRVLGALSLSWATERTFTEQDRAFVRMLAAQCAQAIERTQLIGRQRDVAETLQQAMLPDALPTVDGVAVAACYLPATSDLTVGGDWYDAFTLDDGRLVLAVGDVSGHGVQAAAVMGQVRNSLRAYLVEGHGPALALSMLDELVERAEHGLFATAVVAIYEPDSGRLVWSNAGHPPFVLRTAVGTRLLEGRVAAPIGVRGPEPHVEQEIVLDVGDLLIGYTDGLVERRREDIGVSLDRLVVAVERTPDRVTSDRWCESLVEALLGDQPRADDICVLVARRI